MVAGNGVDGTRALWEGLMRSRTDPLGLHSGPTSDLVRKTRCPIEARFAVPAGAHAAFGSRLLQSGFCGCRNGC